MDKQRWESLCTRMGVRPPATAFDELRTAYSEDHRHYHTAEHIDECLALFDDVRDEAVRPDAVEFAIWLHDIVYSTRKGDNEERSAEVATRWLVAGGADAADREAVEGLILASRHGAPPSKPDCRLLTDIDLHILGSEPERFDRYDADVRREYWWVPKPWYDRKRTEVLRSFLERTPLYQTARIRARFEKRARENLSRVVAGGA